VNESRHARIKDVFLRAVEVASENRAAFVAQECGTDEDLRSEVEMLLAHHDTVTIMETGTGAPTLIMDRRLDQWEPFSSGPLHDDAAATRSLAIPTEFEVTLRRRLAAVVGIFCLGFGLAFLHPLTDDPDWPVRFPSWLLLVAVLGLLCSRRLRLPLWALRAIEYGVLINVGVQAGFLDLRPIVDAARRGDEVTMVSAYHWNFFVWSMLILIYGVFMPNTWRRAALILVPAALIPYIEGFILRQQIPDFAEVLQQDKFGMPVPMTPIAAITAVLAAHLIHTVRREANRARRFAQYRLTRLLGVGGMGEVYEAEHLLLKRPCAVKLIRASHANDVTTMKRFEREVRATAQLTHWNTVDIYDYGQTAEGIFYYVMELLPGMSLAELVGRSGPIGPARTVHFLRQACGALQEAHDIGLIHRDIKPANIFAARRGGYDDVAKLLDFGLVRKTTSSDPRLTALNVVGGTPAYMAPEQADPASPVDRRCDLYSLGAVGYFLLTGRPPFQLETATALLVAQMRAPVEPPSRHGDVPPDVEACILRCLEKLPENRYPSARKLEADLASCACANQWTREDAARWWIEFAEPARATTTAPPDAERSKEPTVRP